jgi:hypothetical protein
LPKVIPANESIQVLPLNPTPTENGGYGLGTQYNGSGQAWKWPVDDFMEAVFFTAYRCEITNYGSEAVLDLKIALDLTFYEAIKVPGQSENARGQGRVRLHRQWGIPVQKIDVGKENSFKFYIYNSQSDLFVHVLLPRTATLRGLSQNERTEVNLVVPELGSSYPLFFDPHTIPTASPKTIPTLLTLYMFDFRQRGGGFYGMHSQTLTN